jgi:hypothetical protein
LAHLIHFSIFLFIFQDLTVNSRKSAPIEASKYGKQYFKFNEALLIKKGCKTEINICEKTKIRSLKNEKITNFYEISVEIVSHYTRTQD